MIHCFKRCMAVVALALVALAGAGVVHAYWSTGSNPGGNGRASDGSLPTVAAPAASLAGRAATVSWAQSLVAGSPLGQLAGGGYTLTRYAESAPATPIASGGTCAGDVSGASDPLSCTEPSLPTGRWRYTVTAKLYNWAGAASAQSTSVVIAPDAPISVALTNGGGTGSTYINVTNQASLTFDVALPSTSLTSDTVTLSLTDGSTTVTTSAAGINGGGTRTFTSIDASGLADGPITVSASATSSDGDPSSSTSITRTKDTVTPTLLTLTMKDTNANGKVDHAVATFSEALAAYSAGTTPWTLSNVPSAGNLASVTTSGTAATLTITEGAGAPDTAVNSFTIALASNATGIRDAAGNQASFTTTSPTDNAKPVLVAGTLAMKDTDGNGKIDQATASFSEPLAPSTDTAPWTLTNVPSAGTLAAVSTSGTTATLTISEGAGAANTAVGTFKIALAASATGIRDAAGNQSTLAATAPADQATPVLISLVMQDTNANGKVDHAVATFSEALAAYSAGTTPWTLSNVPSAGNLASVTTSGTAATLTITEGAGAPDTAVNSFTIALASNATGIRDAAGNQASFTTTSPTDNAKPVLVAGTLAMKDTDGNGKIDQATASFSEPLAPSTDTAPWTLTNVPSAGTLAAVSTSGTTATLTISEGAGAANTAVGTFKIALAASATGIRDAAGNQSTLAATAPADQATPVLISLVMQDTNANGKVDHAVATFSEALAAYSAGTTPWTLSNVPSAGNLASVTTSGTAATLTITEGAGAPDTAVNSFTIALASNATGIRDAAGNQASFTTTSPTDNAKPVLVAGTLAMKDTDGNGKIDQATASFSEPLAPSTDTAPWTLTNVPSAGTLAAVSTSGTTATLTISEGAGAANTAVGTFKIALAASATGIRDAAGNQSTLAATAPADQATPVLISLVMQDTNANGKVDHAVATFSEALAAYSAGTTPWTLSNVPSAGNLASVTTSGTAATLTITEGAGAPDTAVNSFTIALASNATGIRDAAGNQASFTTTSPTDNAKPVPVNVVSANNGITAGLMEAADTFIVTFSEPIATAIGPSTTITETDPSGAGNDKLTITGLTAAAGVATGSNAYILTDNTSAAFASSTISKSGAVITATVAGACSGTCDANITAGIGALVFTPDPTLQDAAGNAAAGSFTTAAAFRLF